MIFGTGELVSGTPNSERENEFARYMASAWVAFASDPKEGLTKFGWPQYNPDSEFSTWFSIPLVANDLKEKTLVGLAYKNSIKSHLLHPSDVEQRCVDLNGDSTPGKGAF